MVVTHRLAVVAQRAHLVGEFGGCGAERAGISHRPEVLGRVETPRTIHAEGTRLATCRAGTVGLGAVLHQVDPVAAGDAQQLLDRPQLPIQVHQHNGTGAGPDATLHTGGVQHGGVGIHVGQHGHCPRPQHRQHRGEGGHGGGDHLVTGTDAQGPQAQLDRVHAVAATQRMGHTQALRPLGLESGDFRPEHPPARADDTFTRGHFRLYQRLRLGPEIVH